MIHEKNGKPNAPGKSPLDDDVGEDLEVCLLFHGCMPACMQKNSMHSLSPATVERTKNVDESGVRIFEASESHLRLGSHSTSSYFAN